MLVMTVATMLGLERLLPHQRMLRKNLLVPYNKSEMAGRILFVSHQWTGHSDADATGEQLRTLQNAVLRLMRGEVEKVENVWHQQIFIGSNEIVTAKQWKAALPHMYVWIDYCSIPQPVAGEFSEDLIPVEINRCGSFFGSFQKSRKKGVFHAGGNANNAEIPDDATQKDTTAVPEFHQQEEKGELVSALTSSCDDFRDDDGNCTTCGFPEPSTKTSDHRQANSSTPEWKKHVTMWLGRAVKSIPAYVERSSIVVVLVPPVEHIDRPGELCNYGNWRGRGWCRLEFSAAVLARTPVRTMVVKSAVAQPEFMFPADAVLLAPGKGAYVSKRTGARACHHRNVCCLAPLALTPGPRMSGS